MKEYLQDGFCASWMMDVEFDLWSEVDRSDFAPKRKYNLSASRECRTLGEIADNSWIWDDRPPPQGRGRVFIFTARWLLLLAEQYKKNRIS